MMKFKSANQRKAVMVQYKRIDGTTHHAKPDSLVTQTVVFDREKWNKNKALMFLKHHDFATKKIDVNDTQLRARQISPAKLDKKEFKAFRPHGYPSSVYLVGSKLK